MNTADYIADLSVIWKQASLVFPYFDRNEVDWDCAYREFLPRIMEAKTPKVAHLLFAEFMNLLGDGHTDYQFPKALLDEVGYLPFSMRYIQGRYSIDTAIPEFQAYLGTEVVSINQIPIHTWIQKLKRYNYHIGNFMPKYRIKLLLPFFLEKQDNIVETSRGSFSFSLLPSRPNNLCEQKLHFPPEYRSLRNGRLDLRLYENRILYIRLDDFMYRQAADEIQKAIEETPELSSILFDLRENVGGMTMNGAKIAELFIPGEFGSCRKRTRSMTGVGLASASQISQWSNEEIKKHIADGLSSREEIQESIDYMANQHYDRYISTHGKPEQKALFDGPCVILTSRHTVSAAEDFIAMFRASNRATVIGTETCGTTGTPFMQDLSCGGWMRICSVGYQLFDGTEFVGCGIRPDIYCEITTEDFAAGYDSVLQTGLSIMKQMK